MPSRKKKGRAVDGVLLLDKAADISSNQALQQVKRLFFAQKAGHTGSLDPLATGLLPICFGEATKFSRYLLEADKRYKAEIILGETRDSADAAGKLVDKKCAMHINDVAVEEALGHFRGVIEQVPPMYSALKHQGQPLYKLARKGIILERAPRHVTIQHLKLTDFTAGECPVVKIELWCSKGTYVRSLAQDLGEYLGVGAHISQLCRTQVSTFKLADALTFATLQDQMQACGVGQSTDAYACLDMHLLSVETVLQHFPRIILSATAASLLRLGQEVQCDVNNIEGIVRLVLGNGMFIGLGQISAQGRIIPKRLIAEAQQA